MKTKGSDRCERGPHLLTTSHREPMRTLPADALYGLSLWPTVRPMATPPDTYALLINHRPDTEKLTRYRVARRNIFVSRRI